MDYTPLLNWDFIENDKMVGTFDTFYALVRKTCNKNPYELRLFKDGNILIFLSFDSINSALTCAQEIVSKYYSMKNAIKNKEEKNNIVYMKEWRERHGSKK